MNLGIIGCGAVSEQCHLPSVLSRTDVRLTAVVDQNAERARVMGAAVNAKICGSVDEALPHIDGAIVALPNSAHAPVSIELLKAGKHVLVEKPMAVTTLECRAMIAAAKQGKAMLAVGHVRRFHPAMRFAKYLIQQNLLGQALSFEFQEGMPFEWPANSDYFLQKRAAGGGVLIDSGAHTLDAVLWWLGDTATVEYADDAYGGVEADCRAELTMASGVSGTIELSRTRLLRNSAIVRGEHGWLEAWFYEPRLALHLTNPSRSDELYFPRGRNLHYDLYVSLFVDQLDSWISAIRNDQTPIVDGVAGERVVSLVERLYAARKPLDLPWMKSDPVAKARVQEMGV